MKLKKFLLGALAIVLIVALTIAGTVAFLTTKEAPMKNVFTVGSVDIELTEDTSKSTVNSVNENSEGGYTYNEIVPGDYIHKEVNVANTGDNDAYVKVVVTLNNASAIDDAIVNYYTAKGYSEAAVQAMYDYIFDGWNVNSALEVSTVENQAMATVTNKANDTYTITYYLFLEEDDDATIFKGFNVPEEFIATQLAMFKDLEINVEASAIQADNFDSAKEAFDALAAIEAGDELYGEPENIWDGKSATYDWLNNPVPTAALNVKGNTYYLNTAADFAGFAKLVNGTAEGYETINFNGATIKLGTDIYLNGNEWTPIGNSDNKFQGTFDGQGHTIYDLKVSGNKSYVGLFGFTTNGAIQNLTVENATVSGYLGVGVVAGSPYTSKFTNITVKGLVKVDGFAYVGGVGGRNAYANWKDITVDVKDGSYVNANSVEEDGTAYRTYVGGVVGFNGEGGHSFENITSNIDVIGSTCDVGGAFGMAHYNNKFVNVKVTGNVEITNAIEAADAEEMGGIAGVWHNQNGTKVTFDTCAFTGTLKANITEGLDLSDNTIVGKAYSASGAGELVILVNGGTPAADADSLIEALENGKDVTLTEDVNINPAGMSNAYGTTGINVNNGQVIDGNGNILDIKGAGGTWDSGICVGNGTIKNITVTGSFRGIFVKNNTEKVVLENVTTTGTVYTISCDQGGHGGLEATGCTFLGWTSFAATIGDVSFTDCDFGEGSGYAYCRPYAPTTFVGCDFEAGFVVDPRANVVFENCTFGGEPLTAENVADLVTNVEKVTVK